jgi:hypothetical protein
MQEITTVADRAAERAFRVNCQKERDDNSRKVAMRFLRKFSPKLCIAQGENPDGSYAFLISRTGFFRSSPITALLVGETGLFLSWQRSAATKLHTGYIRLESDRITPFFEALPHHLVRRWQPNPQISISLTNFGKDMHLISLRYMDKRARTIRNTVKALARDIGGNMQSYAVIAYEYKG